MVHETCYDWRNYGYAEGEVVEGFGTVDNNGFIYDANNERIVCPEAGIEAAAWESGMDNATRFDIEGKAMMISESKFILLEMMIMNQLVM